MLYSLAYLFIIKELKSKALKIGVLTLAQVNKHKKTNKTKKLPTSEVGFVGLNVYGAWITIDIRPAFSNY